MSRYTHQRRRMNIFNPVVAGGGQNVSALFSDSYFSMKGFGVLKFPDFSIFLYS